MLELSVCIIARDEEENIGRALESISNIANEIIVVDTGSKDNTIKIAKAAGARVLNHEWRHDFSEARNFAMDCANNDWVLQLDADEELYEPRPAQISRLISEPEVDAYFCQLVNLVQRDTLQGATNSKAVRLFKRDQYQYEGIIHECATPKLNKGHNRSEWAGLRIIHSGYISSKTKIRKSSRNIELLELALANDPTNCAYHYYLGKELMGLERYEEAIDELKQALSLRPPGERPHHAHFLLGLCECLGCAGKIDEAAEYGELAAKEFPDYRDIIYIAAELHMLAGNHNKALAYYKRCSKMSNVPSRYLRSRQGVDRLARRRVTEYNRNRDIY